MSYFSVSEKIIVDKTHMIFNIFKDITISNNSLQIFIKNKMPKSSRVQVPIVLAGRVHAKYARTTHKHKNSMELLRPC